jgi:PTS system fructose-specific IIC component
VSSVLIDLAKYLDVARIEILRQPLPKISLLDRMATAIAGSGVASDPEGYRIAIRDREGLANTAIGDGVAVPHARMTTVKDFALAMVVIPSGLDYGARDGQPVRIVVMIASPESQRASHLVVLSSVVARLAKPTVRDAILGAEDPVGVLRAFLTA